MKIIFLIYLSFVGIIYTLLDALHDFYVINSKSKRWHNTDAIIKTFICLNIGLSFLFGYLFYDYKYIINYSHLFTIILTITIYLLSWRLLIFDSTLNYFRQLDIFKYKMWLNWYWKISIFIISTIFLILLLWVNIF
jgi:hypothetical protein